MSYVLRCGQICHKSMWRLVIWFLWQRKKKEPNPVTWTWILFPWIEDGSRFLGIVLFAGFQSWVRKSLGLWTINLFEATELFLVENRAVLPT